MNSEAILSILASAAADGAKVAAIATLITGKTTARELADVCNAKVRTMERHNTEAKELVRKSAEVSEKPLRNIAEGVRKSAGGSTQICVENPDDASRAPASMASGATKELPSEVVIPQKLDSPSSVPPKPKAQPRGARLCADWTLPDDWRQWARIHFAHASDAMVDLEADKFRDFWHAKAGQAAAKLDWAATWRNWCRTAFAAKPSSQPINWGRASWEEQKAAKHAATRKMLADLGYDLGVVQ
jgi:hypothetical protein